MLKKEKINNADVFKRRANDYGMISFNENIELPVRSLRKDFTLRTKSKKVKEAFLHDLKGITTEALGVSLESVKLTKLFNSVLVVVKTTDKNAEDRWVENSNAIYEYYKNF